MDPSNHTDTALWHDELSAASQAISPLNVSPHLIKRRADRLRAVKAAPHQPSVWLDYLTELNEERKQCIHHNPTDSHLHMRMHQALQAVYERATHVVPMTATNRHSQVYLRLWLDLAALRAENDPDDAHVIFKHMKSHRIGQSMPLFWNSWADLELRQGNQERATRFRHEAAICSATAATPSRTQPSATASSASQSNGSVQRSARRRVPLRPARRVVNPSPAPSLDKENHSVPTSDRSASVTKSKTDRIPPTTPASTKPKTIQPPESRSRHAEQYSSQRAQNSSSLGKPTILTETAKHSESPELLRSRAELQQRSPPRILSSPELLEPKWKPQRGVESLTKSKLTQVNGTREKDANRVYANTHTSAVSTSAKRDADLERARAKQHEDERLKQIELQRLHERSLQRERGPTLQQEYEEERHRKYAREHQQDFARQNERRAESMRQQQREEDELEKKRQQLEDLERQRFGYRKSEELSPPPVPPRTSRAYSPAAPEQRKRNVSVSREEWEKGSSRARNSNPEPPHQIAPSTGGRELGGSASPSPRLAAGEFGADSTPSTSERPSGRVLAGREQRERGLNEAVSDSKSAKLSKFFQSIQADDLIVVHGRLYLRLEMVGKGGSSKVFKVLSSDMRIMALKRVKVPHCSSFRATIDSYANEIALLKQLRGCPNIIQLYDAEVRRESGLIQLVMEYGDVDLARHLFREKDKKVNENLRRAYWQQMLEAVHTIHEARIIHGDLKPANFLIVSGSLKLIDFGIAKAIQADDTTKIVRDSQVGTPNYMSPEALMCEEDDEEDEYECAEGDRGNGRASRPRRYKVGRASDIWSLGCILYQMVYGRAPFAHIKSTMQKLQCIQNPQYRITFRYTNDPFVIEVLKGCLQRNPEERMSIPELLKHAFVSPESESRKWLNESEVTTTLNTTGDARYFVSLLLDQLEKKGCLIQKREEPYEKLVSELAKSMPLGPNGMQTETGLSAKKDRQGQLLRGVMTPTSSGVTSSQL